MWLEVPLVADSCNMRLLIILSLSATIYGFQPRANGKRYRAGWAAVLFSQEVETQIGFVGPEQGLRPGIDGFPHLQPFLGGDAGRRL
jgi:hypothetical protein